MRIGVRIFLGYFLVIALAGWFLLGTASDQLKPALRQSMEDTLVDSANLLAELARDDLLAGRMADGRFAAAVADFNRRRYDADIWGIRKRAPSHRVYVTNQQGRVVYDSAGLALGQDYSQWRDVYRTLRGQYGARTTRGAPDNPATSVMYVAAPVMAEGRIIGALTIAKPSASVQPFFDQTFATLAKTSAIVLLVCALLGWLLAWGLTRPLARLVDYARAVARGERISLPPLRGQEVAQLGQAVEEMRQQLEGKQYVEHYVHSLTHELKSPLAAIRAAAELIEPSMPPQAQLKFLGHIEQQSLRMTDIIDRLLQLAQLESRQQLEETEPVDLPALLQTACQAKQSAAEQRNITLHCQAEAGQLAGDRFLLAQALSNLLDNALAFAPKGSEIALSGSWQDGSYQISLRDHGPGIPDYALPRLFERFYSLPRPDGSGKSSGLGLPFVREVAALHGGTIQLNNHPDGGVLAQLTLREKHQ